jgi:hypothetical protein
MIVDYHNMGVNHLAKQHKHMGMEVRLLVAPIAALL